MARLQEQYVNEIAPALNKKFGYKSLIPPEDLCFFYPYFKSSCYLRM